ncbi:MAG: FAD/NAD(P)-binding oxidoreductase [Gallionellaceae bacterium]|nr:FAD/NAD(P)-binding oxidoreductase [Gallionellaceae bacterium]
MTLDRRNFIKLLGGASTVAMAGVASVASAAVAAGSASEVMPKGKQRRVVVIGGGYGGTIAAKYVRMLDSTIEVVMIERNKQYVSCPFSNYYIGGLMKDLSPLTISYDKLAKNHGIKMVYADVTAIDPAAKTVTMGDGKTISYDRLIVSPGVDFRTEEIEGYNDQTSLLMPHAWKAGEQTILLRKQLEAMADGGNVIISMPLVPYRCPPGPYERASLIANYLKTNKPKSKVMLLDANADVVAKKPLFTKAWNTYYKDNMVYIPGKKVTKVDAATKTVTVEGIEDFKGDVVNFIPPQRAGRIAVAAGLVGPDKNWCPVDTVSFESKIHKDIHVIGDSAAAGAMPKSGYSANTEAKVCATNLVALMNGKETVDLSTLNVCYSAISDHESISVAFVYKVIDGKIAAVPNSGGISPVDFSTTQHEHIYAESWLKNILTEMST